MSTPREMGMALGPTYARTSKSNISFIALIGGGVAHAAILWLQCFIYVQHWPLETVAC